MILRNILWNYDKLAFSSKQNYREFSDWNITYCRWSFTFVSMTKYPSHNYVFDWSCCGVEPLILRLAMVAVHSCDITHPHKSWDNGKRHVIQFLVFVTLCWSAIYVDPDIRKRHLFIASIYISLHAIMVDVEIVYVLGILMYVGPQQNTCRPRWVTLNKSQISGQNHQLRSFYIIRYNYSNLVWVYVQWRTKSKNPYLLWHRFMILSYRCLWDGDVCSPDYIKRVYTELGQCLTFNSGDLNLQSTHTSEANE